MLGGAEWMPSHGRVKPNFRHASLGASLGQIATMTIRFLIPAMNIFYAQII
jgi:hypothetical protein